MRGLLKQLKHSGQNSTLPLRQFLGEQSDIQIEKGMHVFVVYRRAVLPENLPGDPGIGPARDFHAVQIALSAKTLRGRTDDRTLSGRAGVDQRAVDVPKKKAFCGH
jgi:hypothetical protein